MANKQRIGILTGGGDVPGLNVAIKAVVTRAHARNIDVVGIRRGWMGLVCLNPDDPGSLEKWTMRLPVERVRTIDRTGGTVLHTSRTNPVSMKPHEVPAFIPESRRIVNPDGTIDCTPHVLEVSISWRWTRSSRSGATTPSAMRVISTRRDSRPLPSRRPWTTTCSARTSASAFPPP